MKALDEQDHYEVLEVARDVRREEIDAAYRVARETYSDGSLATYSVFDATDAQAISERIELAYLVLADEAARKEYDISLGIDRSDEPVPAPADESAPPSFEDAPIAGAEAGASFDEFSSLGHEDQEEERGFEGARLRRMRLQRGIEIEDIAEITKISTNYLRCIEEERYADLPAEVYARGFLTAYVQTIGGDPGRIVPDFVEKYRESRAGMRKGFLLSGSP